MSNVRDPLAEINAHERECALRYLYIEKRLDEGSEKFKKLERLLWGGDPFILGSIVLTKYLL